MPSLHARFAGLTLLLLLLWGITTVRVKQRTADLIPTTEIAVEHTGAAGISLTRTSDGRGPVDIGNDDRETIHISLPDAWTRGEVRGAPLASVTTDEPSFGFRRWTFPAGASVTFLSDHVWNKLRVRNISDVPLRLRIVTIDIARGTSTTQSTLISDETLLRFP